MTAFFAGVAVWIVAAAVYLGIAYLTCWGYVGHWPDHPFVLALGAAVVGAQHGAKAAKGLWDA